MLLLVGLGNPGDQYYDNRHNVGFMAVDEIVRRHRFPPWRRKFQAEVSEGFLGVAKVMAMKPQTFMNRSGQAVAEAARFYKLAPADVVVLHDELDLAPGKLRIKQGGGHAGHNGLRDIERHIGPDFRRVRIGIGHPGAKHLVTNYVLSDFAKADDVWLDPLLDAIADAAPHLATGQDEKFMSRVALLTQDTQKD
ncbi:MAG: aminoacyl-tRNA hydrolase [Alphaproteobacteria bacterium]|nr:aminoacyl-tRNA hydrolase [Alphaproteobacteria bacterium]